jgi:hypothetical protein
MSIDVMGVFGEVSKNGIALSMSLMGICFEEVYKKPQRYGYGTQS